MGAIFKNFKSNRRSSRNRAWSQLGADIAGAVARLDSEHLNRIKLTEGILGDIEDRVKGGDQGAGHSPLDALKSFLNAEAEPDPEPPLPSPVQGQPDDGDDGDDGGGPEGAEDEEPA